MTTTYLLFIIAIILMVFFYIRMRINHLKSSGEKFFIIKILQELKDDFRIMKIEKNPELKRMYKIKIFVAILVLLFLVGLVILLIISPVH